MQLQRLELKGFKSFADHTIIPFSGGMTGIVGPNGSGKSNIADAIRWVLGESNVRQLRGAKGEDIIFSGTEKRRPMMAAEATLVFDHCEALSEEKFAETAITRRIYRNGESEFLINKKVVRLKDIHHLLADTGLGKDSMAIIGQNRVDAILNSKPEERRLFFEDVAGISGFKLNKEDALRRMAVTDRNVERVEDLKATLEDQLVVLAKKAEATKQYIALSKEKRIYDGALGLHQYRTSERILTRFENEQIQLQQELSELEQEWKSLESAQVEWANKRKAGREALEELEASYREIQRQGERLLGEQHLLEEKLNHAKQASVQKEEQLKELDIRWTSLKQKMALLEDVLQKDTLDTQFWKEEQEKRQSVLEEAQVLVQKREALYQEAIQHSTEKQSALQEVTIQLDTLAVEKKHVQTQLSDAKALMRTLEQEIAEVRTVVIASVEQRETLQEELQVLESLFQELEKECDDARMGLADLRKQEKELSYALQQKEGRLEVLQSIMEEHEGYSDATKAVLHQTHSPWQHEVRGTVGDALTVEDSYIPAIQVALGAAWQQVMMDTAKGASEAIQYLKNNKKGRVTFLPLDRVRGKKLEASFLKQPGVIGLAVDIVSFDEHYRGVMDQLLGRIVVVDSLQRALAIQKEHHNTLRIVTLEGELLSPGGAMTGGTVRGGVGAILGRKKEHEELTIAVFELRTAHEQIRASLLAEESSLQALLVKKEEQATQLSEKRQECMEATLADSHEQERWERKQKVLAETATKHIALQEGLEAKYQLESTWLEQKEAILRDMISAEEVQLLWKDLQEAQSAESVAKEAVMEANYELSHRTEMLASGKRELQELRQEEEQSSARKLTLQAEWKASQETVDKELPQQLAQMVDDLESQKVVESDIEARRQVALAREEELATQEQRLSLQSTENRQRQHKLNQRQVDVEGRVTKARLDAEQSLQALTQLGFTLQEAQELHLEGKIADWQAEEQRLTAAMEALGTVNPNAIEELEEAEERKHFLEQQLTDLDKAKAQLLEVISEMDAAMSERFGTVFEVVADRFQEVFASLFGGGTAQLVLTEKDNLLASGIEIYIQPPGKKRQPLTLLSGGERALTVIALLFAFLAYRPAPFCVLDEVDAALDEANVERFSKYLKQLDKETQFIVVTHRKKTMEATEKLHGITMVERGVSRLLSVTFDTVRPDMAR